MSIGVKGVRLESTSFERDQSEGGYQISSVYSLISTTDHVLARQSVGGYQGLKIEPSPGTRKALDAFMQSYKADIEATLGLNTEG
jgi:hypothetical protein